MKLIYHDVTTSDINALLLSDGTILVWGVFGEFLIRLDADFSAHSTVDGKVFIIDAPCLQHLFEQGKAALDATKQHAIIQSLLQ